VKHEGEAAENTIETGFPVCFRMTRRSASCQKAKIERDVALPRLFFVPFQQKAISP